MTLPEGYTIRVGIPADAPVVAEQRVRMFTDMGWYTPEDAAPTIAVFEPWVRDEIAAGRYVAFLVEHRGEVVGGVGVRFVSKVPSAADPTTTSAYVLNMSVASEHRRRGLAEALMQTVLEEVSRRGVRLVSLHAAPMGERVYQRLGFAPPGNPELRLTLPES